MKIIYILLQKEKGKPVHDLELKEKKKCASCYGLGVRAGTTCQFLLKCPVLLINFSVASIIVLFITIAINKLGMAIYMK